MGRTYAVRSFPDVLRVNQSLWCYISTATIYS